MQRDTSPYQDDDFREVEFHAESKAALLHSGESRPWDDDVEHQKSQTSSIFRFLSRWRWILDTSLLIIILLLVLDRQMQQQEPSDRMSQNGDITGFVPEFSQQLTTFSPSETYIPTNLSTFLSNETQDAWLGLIPRGLGYLDTTPAKDLNNLPTPLPEYAPKRVFTTSVTHQLHCLHAIVKEFASLQPGAASSRRRAEDDHDQHDGEAHNPEDGGFHLQHCFEYLRQSILCCGDVALEGTQTTFPPGFEGSDGWDAKHVCRDYEQVKTFLDAKRADDELWI
ncbi:hypothetical protein VD0004_g4149 [Verticillium dahliae]|uniref:Oxidase ustYa n=1 Tax=Verticillium dahliae TaxID=27337 RepID=A0A444RQM2_VERDA|nr:hypothetical protein VD0004_g4149 [Verticillium dahliae]PNH73521.1 hypothetical protein VD0001_g4015 [Verticillium dahliae]RXG43533.1 hypothetical protein VDGE_01120 [Verticillium dahliae]